MSHCRSRFAGSKVKLKTSRSHYTLSRFGLCANVSAVDERHQSKARGVIVLITMNLRPAESILRRKNPELPRRLCREDQIGVGGYIKGAHVKNARPEDRTPDWIAREA